MNQKEVKKAGETTEKLKQLIDKKQKLDEKASQITKKQSKKEADPSFREQFADKIVAEVEGLERKDVNDKVLLKFGKFTVARLMLRVNSRFCAYRKDVDGTRLTLSVKNDELEAELKDWIVERVNQLRKESK
jgi:hypothetical protein